MPLLDRDGLKADTWTRGEGDSVIVPWSEAAAALADKGNRRIGIDLPNDVSVLDVAPLFDAVDLIAVQFPSFSDGRGFSIARQLRELGFRGTLRASGKLIADQFAYVIACGFDEMEPTDEVFARQPLEQWQAGAASISLVYQRGYGGAASILDQRRAAREATRG